MTENNLIGKQVQGYTITKKLGSGGYGTVYLGVREDLGRQYQTAIKYMSIPDAEGYEAMLQDYGYDKTAVQEHFEKMMDGITSEIRTLLELSKKDNRYIVSYYDHDIRKTSDPLCFEIFIRMEYLTPLNNHIRQQGMTVGEIIKLGLNMCDALSLCHSSKVIHRDIKEGNIFVNESGHYKLGDFGVAKAVIDSSQSGSMKGTASYMAPEIYLREPYDNSVDLYSLGIVLYKLLNHQRLPFMPDAPTAFTVDDKNTAEARRLKGEMPPLPANAKNRLGEIVVKACSIRSERYDKAEDLKKDLQQFFDTMTAAERDQMAVKPQETYMEETAELSGSGTEDATKTMKAQDASPAAPANQNPYQKPKKKKKRLLIAAVSLIAAGAVGIVGYMGVSRFTDPLPRFQEAVQENDFVKAAQVYEDHLKSGNEEQLARAAIFMLDQAEEIKEQYIQRKIEYEDALNRLQELAKIGIISESETGPAVDEINEIRISRTAYESAQSEIESGDYEAAISDLHKVVQNDPDYASAQEQLAEVVKSYKEGLLAMLPELEADKRYEDIISALKEGLLIVPNDADFQVQLTNYETKMEHNLILTIDEMIREARRVASESDDYPAALSDLRAAEKQYPNREEIKTAVRELEDAYTEKELLEAEALADESRYEEAVDLLSEALAILPDHDSIKEAIAEYKEKYPVLLQQMIYFTGEWLGNGGQELDNLQNEQTNIVVTENSSENSYFDNVYKLNGEYKRITGNWYQPFKRRSDENIKTLEIYGDGRLLYSSEMYAGIEPVSFSVDLTGVEELEISLYNEYGRAAYAKLANVQLLQ